MFNATNDFYFPDRTDYTLGDGTVPSYSALLPGLKWAHEFQFGEAKGAKPIKLIDYCSSHNTTT